MNRLLALALSATYVVQAATVEVPLGPVARMKLIGVSAEPVMYKGKDALRVSHESGEDGRSLVILPDIDFADGVIEYEFSGDVKPGSPPAYRGFTGIAFRVAENGQRYECFYQRPLNSRSPDAQQRKHTVQYISMPGFGWRKLRTETPGKYETWADVPPGEWTKIKIEVKGQTARIYVGDAPQPTMAVADLKQGLSRGTVALWVDMGTVAHFANLRITR